MRVIRLTLALLSMTLGCFVGVGTALGDPGPPPVAPRAESTPVPTEPPARTGAARSSPRSPRSPRWPRPLVSRPSPRSPHRCSRFSAPSRPRLRPPRPPPPRGSRRSRPPRRAALGADRGGGAEPPAAGPATVPALARGADGAAFRARDHGLPGSRCCRPARCGTAGQAASGDRCQGGGQRCPGRRAPDPGLAARWRSASLPTPRRATAEAPAHVRGRRGCPPPPACRPGRALRM